VKKSYKRLALGAMLERVRRKSELKSMTFHEKSIQEKILFALDLPFDYLRKITMPPCEEEHWSHMWGVIWPVPGFFFIIFTIFLTPNWYWLLMYQLLLHFLDSLLASY